MAWGFLFKGDMKGDELRKKQIKTTTTPKTCPPPTQTLYSFIIDYSFFQRIKKIYWGY